MLGLVDGASLSCPTCHRRERWSGGSRQVLIEGGSRAPDGSAERAAFDVLLASHRGLTGPVVARCPCGLPMVTDDRSAASDYHLELPYGELRLAGASLSLNGSPAEVAALEAKVHRDFPLGPTPDSVPLVMAQGTILTLMLFPMAGWFVAATIVVMFYATWATGVGPSVGSAP